MLPVYCQFKSTSGGEGESEIYDEILVFNRERKTWTNFGKMTVSRTRHSIQVLKMVDMYCPIGGSGNCLSIIVGEKSKIFSICYHFSTLVYIVVFKTSKFKLLIKLTNSI